jgi:hypothetical protein
MSLFLEGLTHPWPPRGDRARSRASGRLVTCLLIVGGLLWFSWWWVGFSPLLLFTLTPAWFVGRWAWLNFARMITP